MLPFAVDVMGGDKAPDEIIAGALQARGELDIEVLLVGLPDVVEGHGVPTLPCSEVIAMDEDPGQGVRRKKDSSLVRAAEAVRDGKAAAMVSAGNTGATMGAALLRMGRIKGVHRPAIATTIPVPGASPTILLDSGANAECSAAWLVQFAQMGSVMSTERHGVANPRVGLLSIGEEDTKGNALAKEANALLRDTAGINFIGNVEGRDILTDDVDVVVTDGFTGNVTLKTLEGGVKFIVGKVLEAMMSSDEAKEAAKVLLPALAPIAEQLDPDSQGGAMLLGVDGVCIISHGSSSARAIVNALRVGRDMVERDLVERLKKVVVTPTT